MDYPQNSDAGGIIVIEFEKPWLLMMICCALPACVLTLYRIKKIHEGYRTAEGTARIVRVLRLRTAAWTAGWVCLCCAAAIPLWGTKRTTAVKHGSSVIFAADISRSMTITDILPSRLEFAKEYMTFLLDRLPEAACGLVTVKGQGVLTVPLSFNHQSIRTALQTLSPFSATSAGSNLEHGLRTALNAFPVNRLTGKTVILCTDGDETTGSVTRILPRLRHENIQLIIVGFGTQEGGAVSVLNERQESVLRRSSLPEARLARYAAESLNGSLYLAAAEPGSVWKVLQALENGGGGKEKIISIEKPVRRTFECTAAAVLFFCAGFCAGGFHAKKEG